MGTQKSSTGTLAAEQQSIGGAFSRTDYVLCAHGEAHMLQNSDCYWGQGQHEPIEIVIRPGATDGQLETIAERFGVPMAEMRAFRQKQSVAAASQRENAAR